MTLTIVGLDPGGTTGIALAVQTPNGWLYNTSSAQDHYTVWRLIRPPVTIVIIEKFQASLIDKWGLHTVRLIGGVQALCHEHNIEIIEDTPQQRRPFLKTAQRLRDNGVGHTHHETDAMAHLVRHLYHEGHIQELD